MSEGTIGSERAERVLAACRVGSPDQLREAFAEGPVLLNYTDAVGNTALNLAVKAQSLECIGFLIKQEGLDLDLANKLEGCTPLHTAVLNVSRVDRLEAILQVLLEAGANPNVVNKEGLTPLDVLSHRNSTYTKAAEMLRNAIAALNLGLEQELDASDEGDASSE